MNVREFALILVFVVWGECLEMSDCGSVVVGVMSLYVACNWLLFVALVNCPSFLVWGSSDCNWLQNCRLVVVPPLYCSE